MKITYEMNIDTSDKSVLYIAEAAKVMLLHVAELMDEMTAFGVVCSHVGHEVRTPGASLRIAEIKAST